MDDKELIEKIKAIDKINTKDVKNNKNGIKSINEGLKYKNFSADENK